MSTCGPERNGISISRVQFNSREANPEECVLHEQNGVSVWYVVSWVMVRYG